MAGAEETDELKELVEGLGISESAHFLGRRSDISQLLSAMDVFIFPSFREGLPVSVVEAQAELILARVDRDDHADVAVEDARSGRAVGLFP